MVHPSGCNVGPGTHVEPLKGWGMGGVLGQEFGGAGGMWLGFRCLPGACFTATSASLSERKLGAHCFAITRKQCQTWTCICRDIFWSSRSAGDSLFPFVLRPWMDSCVEVESENEFIVLENQRVILLWTRFLNHIFRLRFKQRQFAFLGIHLRDNTSKQVREALKELKFR